MLILAKCPHISSYVPLVAVESVVGRGLLDVQGFLYPELDRSTGPVQHPSVFPIHLMLLIPLMLCNGRLPCVPLVACIPVFFNSCLQAPLCFPNIHLTTLAGLVTTPASFSLGRGSFTLVRSRRVGPASVVRCMLGKHRGAWRHELKNTGMHATRGTQGSLPLQSISGISNIK